MATYAVNFNDADDALLTKLVNRWNRQNPDDLVSNQKLVRRAVDQWFSGQTQAFRDRRRNAMENSFAAADATTQAQILALLNLTDE